MIIPLLHMRKDDDSWLNTREDICKDSFQNKVISQLMPTICSILQSNSNKKLRLQLNIESPSSLIWRIVNSLSACNYEKAGIATMTNDTVTIEEKKVSQFYVTYFNQTYSLLFNSFHYVIIIVYMNFS